MKNIIVLGVTGSVGTQSLDVIQNNLDKYNLLACSGGYCAKEMIPIIEKYNPKAVCLITKEAADELALMYPSLDVYFGDKGLISIATYNQNEVAILLTAVSGSVGLLPTIEAIKIKRNIALANKETLVTAGHIVMDLAKKNDVQIIPVDSEHSAIFQCLQGENHKDINRLIITASGGTFRDKQRFELENVTVKETLAHPNWSMGAKITVDSATMMNKGLEVIEAHWLFGLDYDKIDTILHRQSVVHSMVEFNDTSVIAHLGTPDMRVPIAYAFEYPKRLDTLKNHQKLDLTKISELNFAHLSQERYPCLKMAYDAGVAGGTMPTVLNAANEVAVSYFLEGKIKFLDIEKVVKYAMDNHEIINCPELDVILEVDRNTRNSCQQFMNSLYT